MRRDAHILLCLILAPFLGAASRPADTAISLQHDGCESRCAVYTLTLSSDGRAVFDGRAYVRKAGAVTTTVPPAIVRAIFAKIADLDVDTLLPLYRRDAGDCERWMEDLPTSTMTFTSPGRYKVVTYNLGCVGPVTSRLAEIDSDINRAAKTQRFFK